jgi:hypothetical protein
MRAWHIAYLLPTMSLRVFVAYAQDVPRIIEPANESLDTLRRVRQNTASIAFERNLNTFNWTGVASVDTVVGEARIKLAEQFTSNVIQIEGSTSSSKPRLRSDQQTLALRLSQPLARELNARAAWSSLAYSDNKSVGLNIASFNGLLGGIEFYPNPLFSVAPMVGYRWETQAGGRDRGLSYEIGASTHDLVSDGYHLTGVAQYHQDRQDPRTLEQHFLRGGAQKTFFGATRDSLELGFSRNRREFYSLTGGNIESRIDNVLSFANLLDYEIDRHVLSTLALSITSRSLDKNFRRLATAADSTLLFNTVIDEFRLDTYLQVAYRSDDGKTSALARLSYSERDEEHRAEPPAESSPKVDDQFVKTDELEKSKNNIARRTALSGTVVYPLTSSDAICVSGTANILRYDTPSDLNDEDRDELLTALTIGTSHRISQYLDVGVNLGGNLSHTVYLLKERSSNNNYNRILRLSPRVAYRPFSFVSTTNTFEVLANYTVYDFEQQATSVRSFSYRQFGWMDSTTVNLTGRIDLDFFAYLKLYERGQLNWSDFVERIENSFADKSYALQVRFAPDERTQFSIGLRYFSQARYIYEGGNRKLDSFLRNFGPTCDVRWAISPYSRLALNGWYEQQRQSDGRTRSLANMALNILITL